MIINLGCGYRMRRLDARNWTLDQLRAPDPNHRFTKDTTPKWHRIESYFQSLDQGLRWCYEHELLKDSDDEVSLRRLSTVPGSFVNSPATSPLTPTVTHQPSKATLLKKRLMPNELRHQPHRPGDA